MRKLLPVLIFYFIFCQVIHSQIPGNYGKPLAEIFTDFHCSLNDTSKTTGFGLSRAYLGYNFLPAGYFSGSLIVNIGTPDDLPEDAVHRRYAYFRVASISYSKRNLNISFGITNTPLTDFQQKFWGKRYVANNYLSINGYGYIADLGLTIDYKINNILKCDFSIMNGEGYSELQGDNSVKTSAGLVITPNKELSFRLYGDVNRSEGVLQYTLVSFAGLKNELITIGIEASYKSNLDLIEGHNSWGISGTGGVNVSKNVEIFTRYDHTTSSSIPENTLQWNWLKDGNFVIAGMQYTFTQNVKMALNYQGTYPYDTGRQNSESIFLNALFKF